MRQRDGPRAVDVEFLARLMRRLSPPQRHQYVSDILERTPQSTGEYQYDQRRDAAKNGGEHEDYEPVGGSGYRAYGRHQLHVAPTHRAERVEGEVDQQGEAEPEQ